MHSYIQTFNLTPVAKRYTTQEIKDEITKQLDIQGVDTAQSSEFFDGIYEAMMVYDRLQAGLLPRFTNALIGYLQSSYYGFESEMSILAFSGVHTIKIRYKYTDSVIKKLVKLAKKDITILQKPSEIFFKGGALHDLIGMQFVCNSPYEKEWVARALYSFFYYQNRTDDHLVYGFYTLKRESGYRGLHCDYSMFHPRFDERFDISQSDVLDVEDYQESMTDMEVLQNYFPIFNIELQIHTAFESLWSSMEHRYSYNIQAKGAGRDEKIRAQWHLLSNSLANLEIQFEHLQIETQEAQYKKEYINGYKFAQELLKAYDAEAYELYNLHIAKSQKLEKLLSSHEISRQEYVQQSYALASDILQASYRDDDTVSFLFKLQSAYIYYSLANHKEYFNAIDIKNFVKEALDTYLSLHQELKESKSIRYKNLIYIAINLRYLQLAQKYGLGLIHTGEGVMDDEDKKLLSYDTNLKLFVEILELINSLDEMSLYALKQDDIAFLKIVQRTDMFAIEWEIFANEEPTQQEYISSLIKRFRDRYITDELLSHFNHLLSSNKIKNVGYIVQFYSTLVWHSLMKPQDALKSIIGYSAYSKIAQSDLFFYELSAYKALVVDDIDKTTPFRLEHIRDFHIKNMIRQLFKIYKTQSKYDYLKAKYIFEYLCKIEFKLDHFSKSVDFKQFF